MQILEMEFSGTIMIFVILLSRYFFLHKLPKKTWIVLWVLAMLRFLLPFSIPFTFSFYSFIEWNPTMVSIEEKGKKEDEFLEKIDRQKEKETIENALKKVEKAEIEDTKIQEKFFSFFPVFWKVGSIICIIIFMIIYAIAYRDFRFSLPVKNEFTQKWLISHKLIRKISIRQSDCILTPLTYGIFHPVILMPQKTDWERKEQLQYILIHEFIHIRQFDAVIKLLLTITVCMHWLNPFVWLMYIIANRDIELSCDEAVMKYFGEELKASYAYTLIAMEERKSSLTAVGNYFSKNPAKERITAIMKYKKSSMIIRSFAVIFVIFISLLFATSAMPTEEAKELTHPYGFYYFINRDTNSKENIDIETTLSKEQQEKLFNVYRNYGIYENDGVYYYKNKMVRCFYDQYAETIKNSQGGRTTNYKKIYTYFNLDGEIDLCAIRDNEIGETKIEDIFLKVRNIIVTKIKNFAVYVPESSLKKIAEKAAKEENKDILRDILPYLSVEDIDDLVEELIKKGKSIQSFIKYASQDLIADLAKNTYKKSGIKETRKFLPYLSEEAVTVLIKEAAKKGNNHEIAEISLFASDYVMP